MEQKLFQGCETEIVADAYNASYLTLRGTMLQLKTLRLVEKGDIEEKTSYNSYVNESINNLTKPKNQYDHNIKELNKTKQKNK